MQIGCYVAAFVLGFLVFIPIGQIVKEYKVMGCILFANVSYVLSGMRLWVLEPRAGCLCPCYVILVEVPILCSMVAILRGSKPHT